MQTPYLHPGESRIGKPVAKFAWLPCMLDDNTWVWLQPVWAWPVLKKRLQRRPRQITLYTLRD